MNNNKKRTMKFLRLMMISAIIGGIFGFTISFFHKEGFLKFNIADSATFFLIIIMIFSIVQIGIFLYCSKCRRQIKKDAYNSDETAIYEKIGNQMEFINNLGSCLTALSLPLLILSMSFSSFIHNSLVFILGCFVILLNTINEVQMLKTVAKVYPEKDADWSSLKFQSLAYEALDECEKEKSGIVGAKVINKLHHIFAFTLVACGLLSRFIEFSGMEFIILGLLWGGFTLFVSLESRKIGNITTNRLL